MGIEPFQLRVLFERDRLRERISDLEKFQSTEMYLTLSDIDKLLLVKQHIAMMDYLSVLDERIKGFPKNKNQEICKSTIKETLDTLDESYKSLVQHVQKAILT